MLYKKTEELKKEVFENPGSEYRGTPFWAWNCRMDKEKIDDTLDALQAMGMGGGHIHCRTGMDNPYMGEEFMDLVQYAHEEFSKRGMLTWLYDEDRWPSGAGGGLVTKDARYRMRFLVFAPADPERLKERKKGPSSTGQAVRSENRTPLGMYQVELKNGCLVSYKRLEEGEQEKEGTTRWTAHLEVSGDNPWFNNQAYLNTLDPAAVQKFVEVTHEKYAGLLGQEFGKTVPAIFTDEPQFCHKTTFGFAEEAAEAIIPFTDDFEETFREATGESLLAHLPELFWELPDGEVSKIRYEYHNHVCERFTEAFADTIGNWCKEHNILLTGHMMEEPTLESQTAALGEAMRAYRSFTLPGVDMLCDRRELSTVKQTQSAAHQFGYEGVTSELYGVTNWDFDFRGHKLQGDWQAALGVTVRVPHLTWTSMAGEAKRDYPAAIGYQSPWYREYPLIENYFARLNTVLTRGKAQTNVGVIHPIESYWLFWGPKEQTGGIRKEMDENFQNLIQWLLYGLIDFDFIAESLLPQLAGEKIRVEGGRLCVGEASYETILVPNCVTLRKTTLDVLEQFTAAGGRVIFAGDLPYLEDAVKSDRPRKLTMNCTCAAFNRCEILKVLESNRLLDVRNEFGDRTDNLICQVREEGEKRWLFFAHVRKMENPDLPGRENLTIRIRGNWKANLYDGMTGKIYPVPSRIENGETVLKQTMYDHDSLLLGLEPSTENVGILTDFIEEKEKAVKVPDMASVTLHEPNVLVLDMAEYRFDQGEWQPREELLRIDNQFRELLGYPLRMEAFAQPWLDQKPLEFEHTLSLRFAVHSSCDLQETCLAMENDENTKIFQDGVLVENCAEGWYTDKSIRKIPLHPMKAGEHVLEVQIPYNRKVNIENMFLLGDFFVNVHGSMAVLEKFEDRIAFGDMTRQGLPFYGGNLTYHFEVETGDGELSLEASMFRAPLLKAAVNGEDKGCLAFSPYRLDLGPVKSGKQEISLTVFGSRINTFGTLHNCNQTEEWYGPNAWRTEGVQWAYEYQLKPAGILKKPELYLK